MTKRRFSFVDILWFSACLTVGIWAGGVVSAGINTPFTGSSYPDVDSQTVFQYRGDSFNRATKNLDVNEQLNRSGTLQPTPALVPPTFEITFDQVPPGDTNTFTAETGQTLTQHSAPTQRHDGTWPNGLSSASGQGHEWVFDGTDDYISSTIGPPAGSFSVACVYTPTNNHGVIAAQADTYGSGHLGWMLYYAADHNTLYFDVSDDGTTAGGHYSSLTKATSGLGKTHFTAITYQYVADGTSVAKMYTDELAVQTSSIFDGPVYASASNMSLGGDADGGYNLGGSNSHCARWDGTVLTAAQVQSFRRYWLGLANRQDNQITVVSAAPASVMVAAPNSGTEPFFRDTGANLTQIGSPASSSGGIYGSKDITNLAQYGSFEVDAGGGHPTGWTVLEFVGDGTCAIDLDTTTMVHGTTSVKCVTTGTTSYASIKSACVAVDKTKDYRFDYWTKHSAGAADQYVDIFSYSDAACTLDGSLVHETHTGDPGASWELKTGTVTAAEWPVTTAYAQTNLYANFHAAGTVYVDGAMFTQSTTKTDAGCWTSAAASAVCNYTNASMTNPLTSGNWEIDFTARMPVAWSTTDLPYFFYVPGTVGNQNRINLLPYSNQISFSVYDSGGTSHDAAVACAKAANVDVAVKAVHTSLGEVYVCCDGTCGTSVTGATMAAPAVTAYVAGTASAGSDAWVKDLNFYSWPDGAGNLYDMSGENLEKGLVSWIPFRATVNATGYKNPLTNTLDAYTFIEDDTAANNHGFTDDYAIPQVTGHSYTGSIYIKKLARTWVNIYEDKTSKGAYFNLSNGTVGTVTAGTTTGVQRLSGDWLRVYFTWIANSNAPNRIYLFAAESDGDIVFDGVLGQEAFAVYLPQVVDNTDGVIVGPGVPKVTTSVTKPRLDLTQHGNPTSGFSEFQTNDGNRMMSRVLGGTGSNQYYSHTYNSIYDFVSGNFTIAAILIPPTGGWAGGDYYVMDYSYGHGKGFRVTLFNNQLYGYFDNAALVPWHIDYTQAIPTTGASVVQLVRNGNTVTGAINGVAGPTMDITGYCPGLHEDFSIGANGAGGGSFPGQIAFAQIDARALSATELAAQREHLWALYSNKSKDIQNWAFTRSTTATKKLGSGPTALSQVAVNVPRAGDGITIEGQSTNYAYYTEAFHAWDLSELTVSANATTAPDGTMTADGMISSSVAGAHSLRIVPTLPAGDLEWSLYAKKGAHNWLYFNSGSYPVDAYFNIDSCTVGTSVVGNTLSTEKLPNGWCRCSAMTNFVAGGGASVYFMPAEADLDHTFAGDDVTIDAYIWGAQVEPGKFATSYIPNPGYATTVTRTADNLSIPLHQTVTRTNYAQYSDQIENVAWGHSGCTCNNTPATTLPNGVTSGYNVFHESGGAWPFFSTRAVPGGFTAGTIYTASIYIKKINRSNWAIGGEDSHHLNFNLTTGATSISGGAINGGLIDAGSGWYRAWVVWSSDGTYSYTPILYADTGVEAGVDQDSAYVYGPQVEAGTYPTAYIGGVTTTAVSVTENTNKNLLPNLIGVVTQLHGLTEAFDSWLNYGTCTVVPNTTVAPDGTTTADTIDNTASDAGQAMYLQTGNLGLLTGRTFTQTVWIKADTPHTCSLRMWTAGEDVWTTVSVTTGWNRFVWTHTFSVSVGNIIEVDVFPGEAYVAKGKAYFWGANLTETALPQGYIPNSGIAASTATKNLASTTLTVEFDGKCEFASSTDNYYFLSIVHSDAAEANNMYIRATSTGVFRASFRDNSNGAHSIDSGAITTFDKWHRYKVFFDLSDMSRMKLLVDNIDVGTSPVGNSGTMLWDTSTLSIYPGSLYNVVQGFCNLKNLRINEVAF